MSTGHGRMEHDEKWSPQALAILSNYERDLYAEFVHHHEYRCFNRKTTVGILKLKSGFEVVGNAGCEDPEKFEEQVGHLYAVKDALRKLSEFAAFHRAEKERWAKPASSISIDVKEEIKEAVKQGIIAASYTLNDPLRRY